MSEPELLDTVHGSEGFESAEVAEHLSEQERGWAEPRLPDQYASMLPFEA